MLLAVSGGTRGKVFSLVASRANCVWQRALPTHLVQASVATSYRTLLASWALIFHAWYPNVTAAHLARHTFLLIFKVSFTITFVASYHFGKTRASSLVT